MRVLIGHDGSSYADAALEDLKRAGLPERVEALVVTVGEAPVVRPLASPEITFAGERVRSIVDHANRQAAAFQEVVKGAHCSVRVGRSTTNADRTSLKVLVGLELAHSDDQVLRRILQRSWSTGTELRVMTGDAHRLHGWQSDGVFRDIFVGDLRVSAATVKGDTQEILLDEARRVEADCIVVGSGLATIAANAECSVEIVR